MATQTINLSQAARAALADNACDCICTGDVGNGNCCPELVIAQTLYLTISGATGDCADAGCMNDLDPEPLDYTAPTKEWVTDGFSIVVPSICPRGPEAESNYLIEAALTCHDTAGSFELRLTGCLFDHVAQTHTSLDCVDFEVVYTGLDIGTCCDPGYNTDNITVTISE